MDTTIANEDFDERRLFEDRSEDDREPGPARAVDLSGRCADCWGPVSGTKDSDGRWNLIQCLTCGRSVNGDDAVREADAMHRGAERNMPLVRKGRPAKYAEDAVFVLKLLPDMDRDKAKVDRRMEASLAVGSKGRRSTRGEIEPGAAGYLYAQARVLLAGVDDLSTEMSAIRLSDLDFSSPRVEAVEGSMADGTGQLTVNLPVSHGKLSGRVLMARMGTTLVAGMTSALACEVGMKAILVTRQDETAKTHGLLELYEALPEDSQRRVEADYPEIAKILERGREMFGKWRYFEPDVAEHAILALVDTERARGLAKAARVIADECVIAGMEFDINVERTFDLSPDDENSDTSQKIRVRLEGGESAVPWDAMLGTAEDVE